MMVTICVQDGHPADKRPLHDLQRFGGRKYEQARIRLLLERLDKEGFSHLTFHHYQNINCKMCPGSCFWSVDHILVIAGC